MIKICFEIQTSQYIFLKNVVLYEIYSKKSKVTNTYVHYLYGSNQRFIIG